ncbi:MAG: winged helix-turn-helix domain-containing protein, partial [Lachnospiraceae bacterium]|nr:winged helix-turn-helix domain-containing protein [Lachnospiraceae bacterium]
VKRTELREEKGLVLQEESYQAFYDGTPLELTLSEFLLLQVLYREPKRAFTREQLILRIFNEDYVGNDRIIDAHVKNLRKKLPGNYIKTVIGVGYQFQEGD